MVVLLPRISVWVKLHYIRPIHPKYLKKSKALREPSQNGRPLPITMFAFPLRTEKKNKKRKTWSNAISVCCFLSTSLSTRTGVLRKEFPYGLQVKKRQYSKRIRFSFEDHIKEQSGLKGYRVLTAIKGQDIRAMWGEFSFWVYAAFNEHSMNGDAPEPWIRFPLFESFARDRDHRSDRTTLFKLSREAARMKSRNF